MLRNEKKSYETPAVQAFGLYAQEELMTVPTVSDTGYGWDDNGPVAPVSGDL